MDNNRALLLHTDTDNGGTLGLVKRKNKDGKFSRASMIGIVLMLILNLALLPILTGCIKEEEYTDYDIAMNQLLYKKTKILAQISNIRNEVTVAKGNTSYIGIIFTDLDRALYDTAYQVMSQRDPLGAEPTEETETTDSIEATEATLPPIVGVMALSPTELPGLDGNITRAEFDELVECGWGIALYFDGEGELYSYIETMRTLIEPLGITELPSTILFKKDVYTVDYDELLLTYGIDIAIHHGENDMPYIEINEPVGVWHPGAVGWKSGMDATYLRRNILLGGGYGFLEVNFGAIEENSDYAFEELNKLGGNDRLPSFTTMVRLLAESVKTGDLEIYSPDSIRYKVERYYSDGVEIDIEYENKKASLEKELKEIERQIDELYKAHMMGGN